MVEEPEKELDEIAEGTRTLGEGIETELKEDLDKTKDEGGRTKRRWWKIWART